MSPVSRRGFLRQSGAVVSGLMLTNASGHSAAPPATRLSVSESIRSDVGSLYPLIESQAVKADFPLSFLNSRFKNLKRWKQTARAKFFELLHYSPPRCDPAAEVVERVDRGDHVCEKIYLNTTPSIRVPAYLLVPKNTRGKLPAIVALHDHGGFYLWGKEKLVETDDEAPALKNWRTTYYGGNALASVLVRMGYVVLVIDMFYWGERRMLLPDDPADWRERPSDISRERISAFNQRASQNEQLVGRTIFAAGFTWAGVMFWDDIRSVDYLLTRPEVDPRRIGCVGLSVDRKSVV